MFTFMDMVERFDGNEQMGTDFLDFVIWLEEQQHVPYHDDINGALTDSILSFSSLNRLNINNDLLFTHSYTLENDITKLS